MHLEVGADEVGHAAIVLFEYPVDAWRGKVLGNMRARSGGEQPTRLVPPKLDGGS
ncbi:MAG: hypothetical protein QM778_11850 [Myxococcales bacterium]